jgi:hypothetical protein
MFSRLSGFIAKGVKTGHVGGEAAHAAPEKLIRRPMARMMMTLAAIGVITVGMSGPATAGEPGLPDTGVNKVTGAAPVPEGNVVRQYETKGYTMTVTETADGRMVFQQDFKPNTNPCLDSFSSDYYNQQCREFRDEYFSQHKRPKYDWEKAMDKSNDRAQHDWRYAQKLHEGRSTVGDWEPVGTKKALMRTLKGIRYEIKNGGDSYAKDQLEWAEGLPHRAGAWLKDQLPEGEDGKKMGGGAVNYIEDAVSNGGAKIWVQNEEGKEDDEKGWQVRAKNKDGLHGGMIEVRRKGNLDDLFGLLK